MSPRSRSMWMRAAMGVVLLVAAAAVYVWLRSAEAPKSASSGGKSSAQAQAQGSRRGASPEAGSVDLSDSQLASVRVEPVAEREFPTEKRSVGSIDFNQDLAVQVFTPYQGRIIGLFAKVGD